MSHVLKGSKKRRERDGYKRDGLGSLKYYVTKFISYVANLDCLGVLD